MQRSIANVSYVKHFQGSLDLAPGPTSPLGRMQQLIYPSPHFSESSIQLTCTCGGKYWPSQKWIHEKCGVANAVSKAVANKRKPGRYRDQEKRREYMRELMRRRRAHQ